MRRQGLPISTETRPAHSLQQKLGGIVMSPVLQLPDKPHKQIKLSAGALLAGSLKHKHDNQYPTVHNEKLRALVDCDESI